MAQWTGPDRRSDELAALRDHFDAAIAEQSRHFDSRLADHRRHFDERLSAIDAKVAPMHDYFTTARIGAIAFKWLVGLGATALAGWAALKGLLK